jgi:SUMO ligase MMS21 Smc5/6 complex component
MLGIIDIHSRQDEILATLVDHECSICLDKLISNAMITKCNHAYHINCINVWRKRHDTCPICRSSF